MRCLPRRQLVGKLVIPVCRETAGTTDHRELTHRDDEDQHPIEAITGLTECLDKLGEQIGAEPIPDKELEEILK